MQTYRIASLIHHVEQSRGRGGLPTVPTIRALFRSLNCPGDPNALSKRDQCVEIAAKLRRRQDAGNEAITLPDPHDLADSERPRQALASCIIPEGEEIPHPFPEPQPPRRDPEPQGEPPAEPQPEPQPAPGPGGGSLDLFFAGAIQQAVDEHLSRAGVDRAAVDALVADAVARVTAPQRITIPDPVGAGDRELGLSHHMLPQLLQWVGMDIPVFLHGPAGSGKSTAARQCATALGLGERVAYIGCSEDTSVPEALAGFRGIDGEVTRTPFRDAWEGVGEFEGGAVILIDELDRAPAGVAAALNGALDGQCVYPFPDKTVPRHPRTRVILAGNTRGDGGDGLYAAAQRQDAALRDRCVVIQWGYDDALTDAVLRSIEGYEANRAAVDAWSRRVRQVRATADKLGIPAVFGPRAEIYGAKALVAGGLTGPEIEAACLRDRVSEDDWRQLEKGGE